MAVYEKELPLAMKVMTQVFDFLEKYLNSRFNRRIISFLYRNAKPGKVTKYLERLNFSLGG